MDTLSRIDALMKSLSVSASERERETWWVEYKMIVSDLEFDKSTTPYERKMVDRVSTTLSHFMGAIRDGLPSPDKSSVGIALNALRSSIAARTVGPDGHRMK
jgi:hypothetical protein